MAIGDVADDSVLEAELFELPTLPEIPGIIVGNLSKKSLNDAGLLLEQNSSHRQLTIPTAMTVAISIVFLMLAMTIGDAVIQNSSEDDFSGNWWEYSTSTSPHNGTADGYIPCSIAGQWNV